MLVNIITLAVVKGFQDEVRNKVIGFGSHAIITKSGENSIFESEPILKAQSFYSSLKKEPYLRHIQPVAYKPVVLQSDRKGTTTQEIEGVLVKGIDETYDWDFIKKHLKSGRIPHIESSTTSDELMISQKIANRLNYKIGDKVRAFFVKNKPVKKIFKLVGIYETGFDEMDKQLIFCDIKNIQQLNDWGIQTTINLHDTLKNGGVVISAETNGGNGKYRYNWGTGFEKYGGFTLHSLKDTVIRVIVSDYWMFIDGQNEETSIPDTSYLSIKVQGTSVTPSKFLKNSDGTIQKEYLDELGFHYYIPTATSDKVEVKVTPGKGSFQKYVGAFECTVKEWDKLDESIENIRRKVILSERNTLLEVTSIVDNQADLFVWLSFLDINVWIIICLMVLIGVINMGSALLVMILVKTNFIGLLKALGANDWTIRKIFLYQASFLILKGMLWGNGIGIVFCLLQQKFKFLSLNPEVYYLDAVPINIGLGSILLLNVGTLLVCLAALIIPSYVITRIAPAKSIKFN
jgi:lipoprotein-releasing system permease protein